VNITEPELLRLVARGENSRAEFKKDVPDDETLAEILCAFANTRGGWLVIGVDEDLSATGCANPKDVMSRVRLVAEEDLKPALNIAQSSVRTEAGFLIAVHVNHSMERPHSIPCANRKRDIMVRVGLTNEVGDGATLNALRSHRTQEQPKDKLEIRILDWLGQREREGIEPAGSASAEIFSQATNVGLRRASKALISLEAGGLIMGYGGRSHRQYALP
jgi:hypothetical protein